MTSSRMHRFATPAALAALLVLALPPVRLAMEASMSRHMLLQFPALLVIGWLCAGALPARWRTVLEPWNRLGISGLMAAALILGIGMIPRVLDLALVDWRIEAIKFVALLSCGAAIRLSWSAGGLVVQGFFLGNLLWMTAVVGLLYQDSPERLCNAYRLDDQQWLGMWLVGISAAIGATWLVRAFRERHAGHEPDRLTS